MSLEVKRGVSLYASRSCDYVLIVFPNSYRFLFFGNFFACFGMM